MLWIGWSAFEKLLTDKLFPSLFLELWEGQSLWRQQGPERAKWQKMKGVVALSSP